MRSEVETIVQGRILFLQKRDRPDLEREPRLHYMAVEVEHLVFGNPVPRTIIVGMCILGEGRGTSPWGRTEKGDEIRVLSPSYWGVGRGVSIGLHPRGPCASLLPPASSSDDEEARIWRAKPTFFTDSSHLFLVDEKGFVIDAERP